MITVTCSQCGKQLSIPDQYAGQTGKCNGCGQSILVPLTGNGPVFNDTPKTQTQQPVCSVCHQGSLQKKKKYRMSGPVLAIGYILLIPSILGMLLGVLLLLGTGAATTEVVTALDQNARAEMLGANIPAALVDKMAGSAELTPAEDAQLSDAQRQVIQNARLSMSAGSIGAGAGGVLMGGFSIVIIVSSFIGGLLGWLLVMKKKVLQCQQCGVVVNAS